MFIQDGENRQSDEKQTLDIALKKIEEGSTAIHHFTRQFTRKFSELERQTTEKSQLVEELTKKLEKSEKKAEEAQKKAEEAKHFMDANYSYLIQDFFEKPKEEFRQSMLDRSNESVKVVFKYAVISILVSLVTATISSISATFYILKVSHDSTQEITTTVQGLVDDVDAQQVSNSREIDDRRNRR
ncbi:MAG: hypothetical protein QNJ46_22185 [Leptolyngbyaceae cyanobacterium MO_188.B28]|nr:hypothetical protein [Leptolyngbyaceae cyanobacterium MO_188.B28]